LKIFIDLLFINPELQTQDSTAFGWRQTKDSRVLLPLLKWSPREDRGAVLADM